MPGIQKSVQVSRTRSNNNLFEITNTKLPTSQFFQLLVSFLFTAIIITEKTLILGFVDVSATELRLNYLLNKNNVQVHAESVKELNNHVNCIRNKMKNPQVDGQKIYQEYLEGGHPNPSSLEDLRYFLLLSPLLANPGKLIQKFPKF